MSNLQRLPESWVPVKGYESLYEISNHGRIKKLPYQYLSGNRKGTFSDSIILKTDRESIEYCMVGLWRNNHVKSCYVHRLVVLHFIGDIPCTHEVNHKDLNRKNNYFENLEIVTGLENVHHSLRMQGNKGILVTSIGIESINIKTGEKRAFQSIKQASIKLRFSEACISSILKGKTKNPKKFTFTKTQA